MTKNSPTENDLNGSRRVIGRFFVLLALLLPFLAGSISCSRHQTQEPFLLQEGKSWQGKFSLGDSGEEATRLLGKPLKQQEDKGWRYCDYGFAEVVIDTKTGEIVSILLRERWKTGSGIYAKDPVEKILSTYGGIAYRPPILSYPKKGVSFALAPGEVTDSDGSKRPGWAAIWVRIYKPER